MIEEKSIRNINSLLDKYRQYIQSDNSKLINSNIFSDNDIYSPEPQMPEILIKQKRNPYLDQNQCFFMNEMFQQDTYLVPNINSNNRLLIYSFQLEK